MDDEIYVVTDGQYSDYHIVGIFTSRDLADTCVSSSPDGGTTYGPMVEVWPLSASPIVWNEQMVHLTGWLENNRQEESTQVWGDWDTGRPRVECVNETHKTVQILARTFEEAQHLFGETRAAWQRERMNEQ